MQNRRTKPLLTASLAGSMADSTSLPSSSSEFDFILTYMRELEARVMDRLELIFERVRTSEDQLACAPRAIRLPEVLRLLGISKSTLYGRLSVCSKLHDPRMPMPFKLGNSERSPSAWWYAEVIAYLACCAQSRKSS